MRSAFKHLFLVGACSAIVVGCAADAPEPPTSPRHPLVGTWQWVEYADTDSMGAVSYPFGTPPLGYIVYDATGRVFVQIAVNPPLSEWPNGVVVEGPAQLDSIPGPDLRSAIKGFTAYFGTYVVDDSAGVVTHQVTADNWLDYTGGAEARPFELSGDTLQLSAGEGTRRVLVRVAPAR